MRSPHARALAVLAMICSLSVSAAAAPADAWAAAKGKLPAATTVLGGLNFRTIENSTIFSMAFPMLLSSQQEVKEAFDLMKSECSIDPIKAIDGVVVGTDDEQTEGAVFLAMNGIDQGKMVACAEAVAKKKKAKNPKVDVTTDGAITELSFDGKKAYVSWITPKVMAVPLKFDDKAMLQKWTGGKNGLAKGVAGKSAGKVNTKAALWLVSSVKREIEGTTVKVAHGSLGMGKVLTIDIKLAMATAAEATKIVEKGNSEIQKLVASGSLTAEVAEMMKKVTVTAKGAEVAIKGTTSEAELMQLAGSMMSP